MESRPCSANPAVAVNAARSAPRMAASHVEDKVGKAVAPVRGRHRPQVREQGRIRMALRRCDLVPGQRRRGQRRPLPARQDRDMARPVRQRPPQHSQALPGRDRSEAAPGEPFRHPGIARGVGPGTPAEALRGQPPGPPVPDQRIEKAVPGRIGRLPRIAEKPGGRGHQHEMPDRMPVRKPVKVPGPDDLGRQHRRHPLRRLSQQNAVIQDACRMDHATQSRPIGQQAVEDRLQRVAIGDVDAVNRCGDTSVAQRADDRHGIRARWPAADQVQIPCATLRQRAGQGEPEPSETARDQPAAARHRIVGPGGKRVPGQRQGQAHAALPRDVAGAGRGAGLGRELRGGFPGSLRDIDQPHRPVAMLLAQRPSETQGQALQQPAIVGSLGRAARDQPQAQRPVGLARHRLHQCKQSPAEPVDLVGQHGRAGTGGFRPVEWPAADHGQGLPARPQGRRHLAFDQSARGAAVAHPGVECPGRCRHGPQGSASPMPPLRRPEATEPIAGRIPILPWARALAAARRPSDGPDRRARPAREAARSQPSPVRQHRRAPGGPARSWGGAGRDRPAARRRWRRCRRDRPSPSQGRRRAT